MIPVISHGFIRVMNHAGVDSAEESCIYIVGCIFSHTATFISTLLGAARHVLLCTNSRWHSAYSSKVW